MKHSETDTALVITLVMWVVVIAFFLYAMFNHVAPHVHLAELLAAQSNWPQANYELLTAMKNALLSMLLLLFFRK